MCSKKTVEQLLAQWIGRRRAEGRKELPKGSPLERLAKKAAASPEGTFTQKVINEWMERGDSENEFSFTSRIANTLPFLRYVTEQDGYNHLVLPRKRLRHNPNGTDRSTSDEELDNLFRASCEFRGASIRCRLTRIEFPVMLRLMESAGLRPNEVRMLRTKDVDLMDGVVDIVNTKGYVQHHVVLHDSMLALLRRYDTKVATILPGRKSFFPTPEDSFQNARWLNSHFRKAWQKYNMGNATSYLLRHDYATRNVNRINGSNQDENLRRLQALQKSMGHCSMESTMGYYNEMAGFGRAMEENNELKDDLLIGKEEEDGSYCG